jgi:hypothetical protein
MGYWISAFCAVWFAFLSVGSSEAGGQAGEGSSPGPRNSVPGKMTGISGVRDVLNARLGEISGRALQESPSGSMPVFTPNPKIDYRIQVMTPDPRIDYKILTVGPTQPPVLTMPNPRFQGGNPPRLPRMHRK